MDLDRSPRRLNADWCNELTPGGTPYFTVSYAKPGVNLPQVETLIYRLKSQTRTVASSALDFCFRTRSRIWRTAIGPPCLRHDVTRWPLSMP